MALKKNKVRRTGKTPILNSTIIALIIFVNLLKLFYGLVDLSAKPEKSHIKILQDLTEFTKDTLPIIREKKESGLDVNYGISHSQQRHFDKYVKVKFGLQLSNGDIKQKTPSKRNVLKAIGKLDVYQNYRHKVQNGF